MLGTQAAKPPDNMSKEMKARLRKEYIGFGGAENSVGARGDWGVVWGTHARLAALHAPTGVGMQALALSGAGVPTLNLSIIWRLNAHESLFAACR